MKSDYRYRYCTTSSFKLSIGILILERVYISTSNVNLKAVLLQIIHSIKNRLVSYRVSVTNVCRIFLVDKI